MVIATKFPPGWLSTAEAFPGALDQSLVRLRRNTIGLYQHHFPSRRIPIPSLMELMADAVAAGKVRAVGVSNYSARQLRSAHAALAERGIPLASNQVVAEQRALLVCASVASLLCAEHRRDTPISRG